MECKYIIITVTLSQEPDQIYLTRMDQTRSKKSSLIWRSAHCKEMKVTVNIMIKFIIYPYIIT